MAAAAHFSAGIYGEITGKPPYVGANPFSSQTNYTQPAALSMPTSGTIFHPLSQGILFGSKYCYSIIEILPQGLQQYSRKLATDQTVATLATSAG
jgi:hypothetical protein